MDEIEGDPPAEVVNSAVNSLEVLSSQEVVAVEEIGRAHV